MNIEQLSRSGASPAARWCGVWRAWLRIVASLDAALRALPEIRALSAESLRAVRISGRAHRIVGGNIVLYSKPLAARGDIRRE